MAATDANLVALRKAFLARAAVENAYRICDFALEELDAAALSSLLRLYDYGVHICYCQADKRCDFTDQRGLEWEYWRRSMAAIVVSGRSRSQRLIKELQKDKDVIVVIAARGQDTVKGGCHNVTQCRRIESHKPRLYGKWVARLTTQALAQLLKGELFKSETCGVENYWIISVVAKHWVADLQVSVLLKIENAIKKIGLGSSVVASTTPSLRSLLDTIPQARSLIFSALPSQDRSNMISALSRLKEGHFGKLAHVYQTLPEFKDAIEELLEYNFKVVFVGKDLNRFWCKIYLPNLEFDFYGGCDPVTLLLLVVWPWKLWEKRHIIPTELHENCLLRGVAPTGWEPASINRVGVKIRLQSHGKGINGVCEDDMSGLVEYPDAGNDGATQHGLTTYLDLTKCSPMASRYLRVPNVDKNGKWFTYFL